MTDVSLFEGDNRVTLRRLIDEGVRVHSVVTDPPYGLVSVQKRFGKEGSAPARTEKNDGSFARLSGGFMGKCFHPETEILTPAGWVRVGEVSIGDSVATLDPQTRELVWQNVAQTHRYPFNGEMVHVKHRSCEQMITPNHKMLVSHDGGTTLDLTVPAQLKKSFHLFAQCQPQRGCLDDVTIRCVREYGKDRIEFRTSESVFDAAAFFRFFGLWLGDGYTVTRKNDHPANDFFGINVKKPRKIKAVRNALNALGIRFKETEQKDKFVAFYCYDFALLGWLKLLGGSKEKYIPSFLFDWDSSLLEHLYQGLMESDGCRQGKNQEVFQTSSQKLADDFQRLCLATGRSAAITFREGGNDVRINGNDTVSSNSWLCCVLQPGKRMYGERSDRSSNVIHEFAYTGEVVCVGVLQHHILYTRFNGKPVWSGNSWDGSGIERDPEFWALIYEILLPGGYCFAFSGARTGHWQACAMELAGFVMHPMHGWCYSQGFPKAHAADKAIDKHLGAKGGLVATGEPVKRMIPGADQNRTGDWIKDNGREYQPGQYVPATEEAAEWEGWAYGTQAQKPALEPIFLAQKPFSEKTGAANLLKHGVGAVNIDGCRVPTDPDVDDPRLGGNGTWGTDKAGKNVYKGGYAGVRVGSSAKGRHPANLFHDGTPEVVALFPDSKGQLGKASTRVDTRKTQHVYGAMNHGSGGQEPRGDSGSAARFYNCFPPDDTPPIFVNKKANKEDRAGSRHPTVKPIALLQHLIRHITPPGGVVLDPFAGSGTTAEAAKREGFDCILMEAEGEYVEFLKERFVELKTDQTVKSKHFVNTHGTAYIDDLADLLG